MSECKFADKLIGVKISGWTVEKLLGTGGFGAVFLLKKGDESAVVKLPLADGRSDFLKEAKSMLHVQSATNTEDRNTHIAKLFDHGTMDIPEIDRKDVPYLIEELAGGTVDREILDYAEKVKEGPPGDVLGYLAEMLLQILRSVFDIHQTGLLNRDIKQENICYPARLKMIKMIDLGLAASFVNDDGSAIIPRIEDTLSGTAEWSSFKSEYLYQQTRTDDLWAWLIAGIEVYYCYADLPQAWSAPMEGKVAGDLDEVLRLLLKQNFVSGELWLPSAHANMHRMRFYLMTLGQMDTPNYFLLAQLTQEMRNKTKKRNKAAISNPVGVREHLQTIGNFFY